MLPVIAGIISGGGRLLAGGAARLMASGGRLLRGGAGAATKSGRAFSPPTARFGSGWPSMRGSGGGGKGGHGPAAHPEHASTRNSALDKLWTAQTGIDLFSRLSTLVGENTSSFVHTITVSVFGGPHADLRRCWYLACAAAFGRYRNRVRGLGQASLDATWDVTGKSVMVTIGYINSGFVELLPQVPRSGLEIFERGAELGRALRRKIVGGAPVAVEPPVGVIPLGKGRTELSARQFLQVGPDQVTVGAGWPDFLSMQRRGGVGPDERIPKDDGGTLGDRCNDHDTFGPITIVSENPSIEVLGEMPDEFANGVSAPWGRVVPHTRASDTTSSYRTYAETGDGSGDPTLPDDGRLITTGEKRNPKVQPPKPILDGKSRMTIVDLIHAALHDPCYAPEALPCSEAPMYATENRVYAAGLNLTDNGLVGDRSFTLALDASPLSKASGTAAPLKTDEPRLVEE